MTPNPPHPISKAPTQAALFQRLRRELLRNNLRVLWTGAPMRIFSIVALSILVWSGLYAVSVWGFNFFRQDQIPFVGRIVGTLFDFLFGALTVMLFFSTALILYSSLFASPETAFLLTTPARADRVFAYKYQGAVAFSSWAFLILGSPILIAYGMASEAPWPFYALLPLFFLGFVLLPGSVGALACLLIVVLMPQKRAQVLGAVVLVLLGVVGFAVWRVNQAMYLDFLNRDLTQQLYEQVGFTRGPLMPSYWMRRGLMAAARGNLDEGFYRLALIWSNGLFLYLVTAWTARRLYRHAYDRIATGGLLRKRYGGGWLDRSVSALLWFLDPQTRLLIIKDFRTFRRDPAQWVQIVIFSGLLVLYFLNTRRFWREEFSRPYQNGISMLNLISVALLMCAYTGRFIYPLLSLEGRKFWVLGQLPMDRDRLLWGKFAFAAVGTLCLPLLLMTVSDLAIGMPMHAIAIHLLTVAVLGLGLSGLSVGLGAWMPNFRESDPSKIAIGFGGTLNLVACLLFVSLTIGVMTVPWHVSAMLDVEADLADIPVDDLCITGLLVGTLFGVIAMKVPLRLGRKALREMEF